MNTTPLATLALAFNLALTAGAAEQAAAAKAADAGISLFDGKSLKGWKESNFAAQGGAKVEANFKDAGPAIIVEQGEVLSGITYTNEVPKVDYEVSLEAMKLQGSDFFCALTFPHKDAHATLVLGGWGGGVVGISSVDNSDASENETTKYFAFDKNKWYRIRVRVTADKIEAWLDDEQITNLETKDKKIGMRPGEIEEAAPLGLSTYQTRSAYRNVRLKKLGAAK